MIDLWYKNAIVYSVDVEFFMDSNGDGVGDFAGLTHRLDHIAGLGVSCIWLMPFYPSPNRDNGYDITNYYGVDPRLGTPGDFAELLRYVSEIDGLERVRAPAMPRDWTLREALATPTLWLLFATRVMTPLGMMMVVPHHVAYLVGEGFDKLTAAFAFGSLGAFSFTGRVVFGPPFEQARLPELPVVLIEPVDTPVLPRHQDGRSRRNDRLSVSVGDPEVKERVHPFAEVPDSPARVDATGRRFDSALVTTIPSKPV
jgi:hypothetical protein